MLFIYIYIYKRRVVAIITLLLKVGIHLVFPYLIMFTMYDYNNVALYFY